MFRFDCPIPFAAARHHGAALMACIFMSMALGAPAAAEASDSLDRGPLRQRDPVPLQAAHGGGTAGAGDRPIHHYELVDLEISESGQQMFALVRDANNLQVIESINEGQSWIPTLGVSGVAHADMEIAEGIDDKVFVATTGSSTRIFVRDLAASSHASWDIHTLPIGTAGSEAPIAITTDSYHHLSYWVYVAVGSTNGSDGVVHFTRSLNRGASWETPQTFLASPPGNESTDVVEIDIDVSNGTQTVHIAALGYDQGLENVVYRRGPSWGAAGSWADATLISSWHTGGKRYLRLVALSSSLQLFYERGLVEATGVLLPSSDFGVTWDFEDSQHLYSGFAVDNQLSHTALARTRDGSQMAYARYDEETETTTLRVASATLPISFGAARSFPDATPSPERVALTASLHHFNRWAVGFSRPRGTQPWAHVDAEWFADTGYPQIEYGFPLETPSPLIGHPAVIDLDDDGDLEIVVAASDRIWAYDPDGSVQSGWPTDIDNLYTGVAPSMRDLDGDGLPNVVVGNADGEAHLLSSTGTHLPGWPVFVGPGDCFALGAHRLDGTSASYVVAVADERLRILDVDGSVADAHNWVVGPATVPPAVGDLDGNGIQDIVIATSDGGTHAIGIYEMYGSTWKHLLLLASPASAAPVIGDLDGDTHFEVLLPLANGQVLGFDADLAPLPGWSFTAPSGPIGGLAVADVVGDARDEVLIDVAGAGLYLTDHVGGTLPGFPTSVWSSDAPAPPILPLMDPMGAQPMARRGPLTGLWSTNGSTYSGWPAMGQPTGPSLTPATGDIDQDGRTEIVVATGAWLYVYEPDLDGGGAARAQVADSWPMYGGSASRSGCFDCEEDATTAIAMEPAPATRAPVLLLAPNPMRSQTQLRFALSESSHVRVTMYDVTGRAVSSLIDEVLAAGDRALPMPVASHVANGVYFVRLEVDGVQRAVERLIVER